VHSDPQPIDRSPAPEQIIKSIERLQAESTNLAETEQNQANGNGSQPRLLSDSPRPNASELGVRGTKVTTPGKDGFIRRRLAIAVRHPVTVHLAILLGYIGVGIAVTWPHVTYLAGRLPYTRDAGTYVWNFWWIARSVEHLSNPWSTTYLAAPVGAELGLHALMPLPGLVMMPVTVLFGPSASYNVLCIALPGLLSYAMYRAARLWLRSQVAAIAAGGFFGFSLIVDFWTWNHINLAAGALFMPLTLEVAVRLRRRPGPKQALILGLVLGASVLVDQDSALMAALLAGAVLLPWLFGRPVPPDPADRSIAARVLSAPRWKRLGPVALAALVTAVVASPQLLAIAHEIKVAGSPTPPSPRGYRNGATLPNLFEPSPRVADLGLHIPHTPDFTTYGAVLTILAIAGLAVAWRQRAAWGLALGWLGATVLTLGSRLNIGHHHHYLPIALVWHGFRLSSVMPYTWIVTAPGLSSFRVPGRVAEMGLVPAAVLAGFTVNWLRNHAPLIMLPVLAAAVLEAGLSTPPGVGTMPTALPALDRPIAADHSGSIVVDVPVGIRGGAGVSGSPFPPNSQVLATADGHPRTVANLSRIPPATTRGIQHQPFYAYLISVQKGHYYIKAEHLKEAAQNARSMHIGWVLVWISDPHIKHYLRATGFRFDYRADGVSVYRPVRATR